MRNICVALVYLGLLQCSFFVNRVRNVEIYTLLAYLGALFISFTLNCPEYVPMALAVLFLFSFFSIEEKLKLQDRYDPVDVSIEYFSKLGKVRKIGRGDYGEYRLKLRIKNMEPEIRVFIQYNGDWRLAYLDYDPAELKLLASVGIDKREGTLREIRKIVEEGKSGACVKML